MTIHHTKYKRNYLNYLAEVMETSHLRYPIEEAMERIFERFYSEFQHRIIQVGMHEAMVDWLQGLAIPIPFYNDEIVELAITMGSASEDMSDRQRERICDNYFRFMASIILEFEPKYSIVRHMRGDDEGFRLPGRAHRNLNISQARSHCKDPSTSTPEYFDGYAFTRYTVKRLRF